jgi:hypothetical protein
VAGARRLRLRPRSRRAAARRPVARLETRLTADDARWAQAREALASPILAPLAPSLARLAADRWPTLDELDALAAGITTARGMPLRFVRARGPGDRAGRRYYELHIDETGEVETRPGSWHDLFNALAWVAYPRAKARINAQHVAIFEARGAEEARSRSPARDALTLFDEGGVAVASSDPAFFRLVEDFAWKALFWERREELARHVRFLSFGHSLHEKALAPHVGMVAKAMFVPVDESFHALAPAAQVAHVDAALEAHFADPARFASPRIMPPIPVMGIPGWHPRTAEAAFYDDRGHFRPKTRP